jgi:hypothetical protein
MTTTSTDLSNKLANLVAQGQLQAQLNPSDPHVAVLVLASDHQTILDCELRPFSELAAALSIQEPISTHQGE